MYARVGMCCHDVQDTIRRGSCYCQGHGFSSRLGHQHVMGDLQLSGLSAFVSQLICNFLVCLLSFLSYSFLEMFWCPGMRILQVQLMLLYPVGGSNHGCGCVPKHMGQLVAEVSSHKGGSGVKTRWKCEACACTSSGGYCGHLDFCSGGRVRSRSCKKQLNCSHYVIAVDANSPSFSCFFSSGLLKCTTSSCCVV